MSDENFSVEALEKELAELNAHQERQRQNEPRRPLAELKQVILAALRGLPRVMPPNDRPAPDEEDILFRDLARTRPPMDPDAEGVQRLPQSETFDLDDYYSPEEQAKPGFFVFDPKVFGEEDAGSQEPPP